MVKRNEKKCPSCGGRLRYYDHVRRVVRTKNRISNHILICRLECLLCGCVHREIPDSIFPYKQYEAEVIRGVLEGYITPETLGYEDYPCETTMVRWTLREKDNSFYEREVVNMKDLIKIVGLGMISGAAVNAGMRIYDELLDEKVTLSIIKLKSKLKKTQKIGLRLSSFIFANFTTYIMKLIINFKGE